MRLSIFCLNLLIVSQFLDSNPILFHDQVVSGSIGIEAVKISSSSTKNFMQYIFPTLTI